MPGMSTSFRDVFSFRCSCFIAYHTAPCANDALQAVGFSGAVGAGRGEDALGSRVIEFENSLVAAAEVTCVVPAQTEISDHSSAFHAETVHCWSPCQ